MKRVSKSLIDRLNSLPRKSRYVFEEHTYNAMRSNREHQRKRLAEKLKNPEIAETTLCSVRHWYATKYYHETRDLLKTQKEMGHRSINSTLQYIDLERAIYGETDDDDWIIKFAGSQEEAEELAVVGFEYVAEIYGKPMFRKRK